MEPRSEARGRPPGGPAGRRTAAGPIREPQFWQATAAMHQDRVRYRGFPGRHSRRLFARSLQSGHTAASRRPVRSLGQPTLVLCVRRGDGYVPGARGAVTRAKRLRLQRTIALSGRDGSGPPAGAVGGSFTINKFHPGRAERRRAAAARSVGMGQQLREPATFGSVECSHSALTIRGGLNRFGLD